MVWELSGKNIGEMFTTAQQVGLYHPLTMLSLAVDYELWGANAFGFHLTSLLLHLLNMVLVLVWVSRLFGSRVLGLFVALLFGIHPMHVESVAWISARKDVLFMVFYMGALLLYERYGKRVGVKSLWGQSVSSDDPSKMGNVPSQGGLSQGSGTAHAGSGSQSEGNAPDAVPFDAQKKAGGISWLILCGLCFVCALLSKATAFTLPVVLLLVDYVKGRAWSWRLILEKLPFFALAGAAVLIAQMGQAESDSILESARYSIGQTVFMGSHNALVYVGKVLFPVALSPFHPFPFQGSVDLSWIFYASMPLFLGGLVVMGWLFKRNRVLFFGLSFFLVTIAFNLQIIPYGKALMAERYTYLPYLGLFLVLGYGLMWLGGRLAMLEGKQPSGEQSAQQGRGGQRLALPLLGGVLIIWLAWLGVTTYQETKGWRNGDTLWSTVIAAAPDHYFGYLSRGKYYVDHPPAGKDSLFYAKADLEVAMDLYPEQAESYYERGRVLEKLNEPALAYQDYTQAVQRDSSLARAWLNRGLISARKQDLNAAKADFNAAIGADEAYALGYLNRGLVADLQGDSIRAWQDYSQAITLEPWNALFYRYRGNFGAKIGRLSAAEADYSEALRLEPKRGMTWWSRARVRAALGKVQEAKADAARAQALGVEIPEGFPEE